MLSLADKDGKTRWRLGVDSDGSPMLSLADKDGKSRLDMGLNPDGTPWHKGLKP